MMLSEKKAVLFDLDGTIIDSELGIFNALSYMFERIGMTSVEKSDFRVFIGPSIGATLRQRYGFTLEEAENAVAIYREYYSTRGYLECTPYAGIESLLASLKDKGSQIALATKKPELFSRMIISKLGFEKYFDAICGSALDDHNDSKAHIIKNALKALSLPAKSCVMVGDTKYDAIAAREVGVDCIGVLYGFGNRLELEENAACAIVSTTSELSKLLLMTE